MTVIKFCGMTRQDDVRAACDFGVNAIGLVMWPGSPRYVDSAQAGALIAVMPAEVSPVGVFVAPTRDELAAARDAGVRVFQIHGRPNADTLAALDSTTLEVWLAMSLDADVASIDPAITIVLDAYDPVRHGGTGRTIDWSRAATVAASRRVMLAGGLTPANVSDAIRQVKPFGVDVASGIEQRPAIKDVQAMKAFVAAVREADE